MTSAASTEAFFTNSSEAFERREVTSGHLTADEDIDAVYEVHRCVSWIKRGGYKRVALQFPDELMCNSVTIVARLQALLPPDVSLFILGDTSYGSCCVDEVAAEHYAADGIVHYGRSCLSSTCRLPVMFVFGSLPVDVTDCVGQLSALVSDPDTPVVLLYDAVYAYAVDEISRGLLSPFKNLVTSRLMVPDSQQETRSDSSGSDEQLNRNIITRCGRVISLPSTTQLNDHIAFYIGHEGLTLNNFILSFRECQFFTYNPATREARKETLSVNKALMKRYFMIEKAKDAQIVGILVGTLGVANYMAALNHLKSLLKLAGKKCYTFLVGKINVPKLANFMEVDVFVLIACAENSLLDSSDYYKPIVTPFEMEIACNPEHDWTGEYTTDFNQLLPGGKHHVELPDRIHQEETTDVSLITGKLRRTGQSDVPLETGTALVARDGAMHLAVQSENAAEFLQQRSWKGLEQKLGETPVTMATEGAKGIAMTYSHEPNNPSSQ